MQLAPTVTATALPTLGASPRFTEQDALPSSVTDAPVRAGAGDVYQGHVALLQRGDTYPYVGRVMSTSEGSDEWRIPAVRIVTGSIDDAVSGAAQMSADIVAGHFYGDNLATPPAVGAFDAGAGTYALGSLFWNDANNGDATNLPLVAGSQVRKASPQLVAVASRDAVARFDRA